MLRNPGLRKSVEQPVLDLNFAASQIGSNAAPDSRIDFSRGTNAWFVDSDGLVKKSPHNLILASETFVHGASGWLRAGTTLEASLESPDGIDGSTKLTWTGTGVFYNVVSVVAGQKYRFSYYVKLGTKPDNRYAVYDQTNSAFVITSTVATGVSSSEWTRVYVEATAPSGCTLLRFYPDRVDTSDGTGTTFITGVQVSQHTTLPVDNPYIKTTGSAVYAARLDHDPATNTPKGLLIEEARTNLITDSESHTYLDGDILVAQTGNAGLAPDGTNTAIALMETAGTGNHVSRRTGITIADNGNIIFSFFVKANGRTNGAIELFGTGTGGAFVFFNLSTGQITTFGHSAYGGATNLSSSIEDYGNGWFRVSLGITTVSGGTSATVQIRVFDTNTTNEYAGDATKGLFIWGIQLEQGFFLTSYIKTTGSSVTRNADVATMGPTTGGTELVTNGTFDTDTTGWTEGQTSGVTATVSSGVVTASASTASGSGIFYQSAANTPTVIGRRYRATAELSVVSGSGVGLIVYSSFFAGSLGTSSITSGSNQTVTVDFTATTTATHIAIIRVSPFATNDVYDIDNVSVRELYPFEQYNPSEGTLYSLSSCIGNDTHTVLSVHADSFDNYFSHTYRFGNSLRNFSKGGGSTELQTAEAVTLSNRNEIATTYDGTSMDMSANGSDETTGTLGADIVGIHEIAFGLRYTANQYSGHIERVQYFPRALPKVTLQSLTSD